MTTVLLQFARPAVLLRFLLQLIFTPPVLRDKRASCPCVTCSSSSLSRSCASSSFLASNSRFLASIAFFSSVAAFLAGLLAAVFAGLLLPSVLRLAGDSEGDSFPLSLPLAFSSKIFHLFLGLNVNGGLAGE